MKDAKKKIKIIECK